MTSVASRHGASSYRYYSSLSLVSGPMQASRCATWHQCEAFTFWRFTFDDFKLWASELNSLKDLILESGLHLIGAPMRCPYSIDLAKKHLAILSQSTWILNWVLDKFIIDKEDPDHPASTHLPGTRACWRGLIPGVPPCIDLGDPRWGPLRLSPPSIMF
jgi:hypothetical protein